MKIVIANSSHITYAEIICDTIKESAKVRGTGIAERTPEYIINKMSKGDAIIAIDKDAFAGFSYIETWDNKEFVVNGRTKEQFKIALDLLLLDEYGNEIKVNGWEMHPQKGFILKKVVREGDKSFTDNMGVSKFISKEDLVELLWEWLDSDESNDIETNGEWESNHQHDGHNTKGWKLYSEDWGKVDGDWTNIAAFKRIYCWYGK